MTRDCLNQKYEDTIQCSFFSRKHLSSTEWDQLCEEINKTVHQLSIDYIWHKDKFSVYLPVLDNIDETPARLVSTTSFGDNIEDEWFIVYLILEITKVFNHLIVQLEDNDGDFILIEAADYLPSWANPDTTVNRVFIHNHHIHIIPPALSTTDVSLNISDAINLVAQNSDITKASSDIQNVILKRVGNFPQKMYENFHKAILKLPLEIATILTLEPSLISPIVNTYCNLDSLEARNCKDIVFEDCVNVEVKFTKYLYAMLLHSPLLSTIKYKVLPSDKKGQLGLKLASGYKVIMNQSSKDLLSTIGYQRFLESLTKNGYFKNNIEGSIHYKQLLEKANFYFLNMESPVNSHVCSLVNQLKSSIEFVSTSNDIKNKSDSGNLKEDDDKWLTIHPDELNNLLNNQYGKKVVNETVTPHLITTELSNFLKKTSDFEGIEQTRNEDTEDGDIEFDSKDFVSCIQKMLNLVTNKNELDIEDCSDISEEDCSDTENLAQDLELACKLKTINGESAKDDKNIFNNLVQSMKEEGLSGPSSTVLRTIGVNKSDILDSDDDDE